MNDRHLGVFSICLIPSPRRMFIIFALAMNECRRNLSKVSVPTPSRSPSCESPKYDALVLLLVLSSSDNRADCTRGSVVDNWVLVHLALVVPQSGLGHGTHITLLAFSSRWVVRRKHARDGSDDRAHGLVHRLVLGFLDRLLERGTGACIAEVLGCGAWDAGVS